MFQKRSIILSIALCITLCLIVFISFDENQQHKALEIEFKESLKLIHRLQSIYKDTTGKYGHSFEQIGYKINANINDDGYHHFKYELLIDSLNFRAIATYIDKEAEFIGKKWQINQRGIITEILE